MEPTTLMVVMTTVPDTAEADTLARELVDRRLAACVQLVDITSHYRWDGHVRDEPEVLLLIKTPAEALDRLMVIAADIHPYETPELVAVSSTAVDQRYAAWAKTQVEIGTG